MRAAVLLGSPHDSEAKSPEAGILVSGTSGGDSASWLMLHRSPHAHTVASQESSLLKVYLESHGDLGNVLKSPISHIMTPDIPIINPFTKSPYKP